MKRNDIIAVVAVTALIGLMFLLVEVIPPKANTVSAITETFARISIYARQSNSLPASLEVLPKRKGYANQTTDGWNRPLHFDVDRDGIMRLTSFGKDGKPGGVGDNADITRAYHSKRADGTLWATAEMWMVEGAITEKEPQPTNAPYSDPAARSQKR